MRAWQRAWPLLLTIGFVALGLGVYAWLVEAGFPGAPSACLTRFVCYCEVPRAGLARQPANTGSNVAFFASALWIAFDAARFVRAREREVRRVGIAFALGTAAQGVASMYFHGTLTNWGAITDAVSIFIVPGLVLGVNYVRLGSLVPGLAVLPGLAAVVLALGYRLFVLPVAAPLVLLAAIGIVWSERRAHARDENRAARRWFSTSLVLLGLSAVIWGLSLKPGFPLCSLERPWGHAAWHVFAAGVMATLWLYAREALRTRLLSPA